MGTRVEQPSELVPCASRTGYRQHKDLANPFHRLSPAIEDLHVIVPRGNWLVLLQNGFCIILPPVRSVPGDTASEDRGDTGGAPRPRCADSRRQRCRLAPAKVP